MADKSLVRDSSNNGMLPMFNLVNSFVDDAVPTTLNDLIQEYDVSRLDEFSKVPRNAWFLMAIGLVICVGVGLIFVLSFPICGCCYCCCRCLCGCCKPYKVKYGHPKQPSKCKQWSCSSILFVLVITMFSVVICSYVATNMIKEEIGEDGKALNDFVIGLEYLENYLNDSVDDIEEAIFPPLNETITEVFLILDTLPATTVGKFANDTGVYPALYELDEYAQNIPSLHGNLTDMDNSKGVLVAEEKTLSNDLSTARSDIEPLLQQCINSSQHCKDIEAGLEQLQPDAQYVQLDNVTDAIDMTQVAISAAIPAIVSGFVDGFEAIGTTIDNEIGSQVDDIKQKVDEIQAKMETEFERISQDVKTINFDAAKEKIMEFQPTVEQYGTYFYKYLYLISTLCLIPTILYLIGIPLGTFGSPGAAKHSSNCLMAGIAITFIFGFLIMLTTTLMFALGGTMQGLLCRHVVGYDETMQSLESVIRNQIMEDNNKPYPYNLTVKELLENCKNDVALYTAFNIAANGFNISEYLDLDNTQLPEVIEGLKNITFDIGTIEVITPEVNATILAIEQATDDIDFNAYNDELKKGITQTDVKDYANELYRLANDLGDPTLSPSIKSEADKLMAIYNTTILSMEAQKDILTTATAETYEITSAVRLSSVMHELTEAQVILNTQTDKMIQEIVGESADDVYNILNNLAKGLATSIENDIAKCRPAYDALTTVVYAPCVYFLYPFDAIWFCYGWYFAFGFVAIFFATSVIGMFRIKALGLKVYPGDIPEDQLKNGGVKSNQVSAELEDQYADYLELTQNELKLPVATENKTVVDF